MRSTIPSKASPISSTSPAVPTAWMKSANCLSQAEDELGRIAHITRQSLGFYRETSTPTHFMPAIIVREVTDFYASRAIRLGISFIVNANNGKGGSGLAR